MQLVNESFDGYVELQLREMWRILWWHIVVVCFELEFASMC